MSASRHCDVTPDTLPLLERALQNLASDLEDPYRLESKTLHHALFAENPAAFGALALTPSGELLGASLYSPLLSTTRGFGGAYVSDLWVSEAARGNNAGRKLLAYVGNRANEMWDARFVRLTVYDTNIAARRFYERLGFEAHSDEITLTLSSDQLGTFEE